MRLHLRLLGLGVLSASLALASPPPFDFTGTWTGSVATRRDSIGVDAVFTSTGPRTFTGSMTFLATPPATGATCEVNGTYGKRVRLQLACEHAPGESGTSIVRARLNPTADTLRAPVHFWVRGHGAHRAQFTLTKN